MAKRPYFIGVDIGGTKIAAGLATRDGQVIRRVTLPTPADRGADALVQQIFDSIEAVVEGDSAAGAQPSGKADRLHRVKESTIGGIGVVAPGPLDTSTGELLYSPNLPSVQNLALGRMITDRYGCPVRLENDANAAALAEAHWGAGVGHRYVFYVTVSTGIGTGIVLDGRVYSGRRGFAAEGGHVTINYLGPECSCGHKGCIEAYASGTGLSRRAVARLKTLDPASREPTYGGRLLELCAGDSSKMTARIVAEAALLGDRLALELIDETVTYLSIWLGGMVNLFDPDIIVIGGGLSAMGDLLFTPLRERTPQHSILPSARAIQIVPAELGEDVGILGAVALFAAEGARPGAFRASGSQTLHPARE